jgi:hypothetical protein
LRFNTEPGRYRLTSQPEQPVYAPGLGLLDRTFREPLEALELDLDLKEGTITYVRVLRYTEPRGTDALAKSVPEPPSKSRSRDTFHTRVNHYEWGRSIEVIAPELGRLQIAECRETLD